MKSHLALVVLAEPNPARLNALIAHEGVEAHRSLFCAHYDSCLDEALRQHWRSWSCAHCRLFDPPNGLDDGTATQPGAA
jgi:hypothetical protein